MLVLALFLAYIAISFGVSGAFLADAQWRYPFGHKEDEKFRRVHYRSDLSACVFFGLIPISWIICPFATGFFQHGWQLRYKTFEEKYGRKSDKTQ
jgi:hypothetical protein